MRRQLFVFSTRLHAYDLVAKSSPLDLSAAVDVYGEWVDAAGMLLVPMKQDYSSGLIMF